MSGTVTLLALGPWKRFERAAGVVAKSPPQHRVAKKEKDGCEENQTEEEARQVSRASDFGGPKCLNQ
jgi:hypothetical protein